MAKGRIRNRMELRADYEAAERQRKETQEPDEAVVADESSEGGKAAPKKKKAKETKPKRSRTAKITRQRIVWVVYDNSNKKVGETFPYPQKQAAEELAARLSAEKKTTYFVQPLKEAIED